MNIIRGGHNVTPERIAEITRLVLDCYEEIAEGPSEEQIPRLDYLQGYFDACFQSCDAIRAD